MIRQITKTPSEIISYTIDLTDDLRGISNASISTVTGAARDLADDSSYESMIVAVSKQDHEITVRIGAGVLGKTYEVKLTANIHNGDVIEKAIIVKVRAAKI